MRKQVNCAAAVIVHEGRIMAAERGYGAYKDGWEFPGGKIEAGETGEEAVQRELMEEMNFRVEPVRLLKTVRCAYETFDLTLQCYLCHVKDLHYEMKEHENIRWLARDEWNSVNWLKADQMLVNDLISGKIALGEEEV